MGEGFLPKDPKNQDQSFETNFYILDYFGT